ncbi:1-acyl-sn-glycerol-3-phosphate acyltransferase [Sphingomonas oleivorans]|uniref:1-acyl-sn-glycerol-3-phosphate acyltransferase n=1 Tax=Sphingomonas oleivorans TaxID=1735121 RepID=A0A2T5G2S8_9SPHN|nr:lysophospholipid acyltransferase family protein [Sphingomonas oleivorans]PTQ13452.1 1-acyl-sn-glycerol-3-phosphate acyltransferase [Sphingomonas oleivorans]
MKPGPLRSGLALLAALTMVPGWFTEAPGSPRARVRERRFLERAARAFLRAVDMRGAPPAGPGTLYVANHMSWLDIPVLASRLDARFVAKAEVGGWPLIGLLARRAGTLFVKRERRQEAGAQADAIAERLRRGDSLILFPEGTTSDGTAVLPFRTSLFAAAAAAICVQPLAICYRRPDGTALDGADLAAFAWVDDEPLPPNAARAARAGLRAEILLQPPIPVDPAESRKSLADRCRAAVVDAYAAMRAAPNRSE